MTRVAPSTASFRSIGGVVLVLAGGLGLLFGGALGLLGVWICLDGSIVSGHIPGLAVLGQATVIILVARWALRRGLKIQDEIQNQTRS